MSDIALEVKIYSTLDSEMTLKIKQRMNVANQWLIVIVNVITDLTCYRNFVMPWVEPSRPQQLDLYQRPTKNTEMWKSRQYH